MTVVRPYNAPLIVMASTHPVCLCLVDIQSLYLFRPGIGALSVS